MRTSIRSTLVLIAITLTVCENGCRERPAELAGKWSGSGTLASQNSRAPGSSQLQPAKPVPVQITLTINPTGDNFAGDAAIEINKQPAVHIPITAGTVDRGGKVSLEADKSGFSNVHLSFNGRLASGQLSGDVALKMDTLLGVAENSGSIVLTHSSSSI